VAVVAAPATFGTFPNAILIGNFGDGTINAFDTTGKFLGQLTDSSNHPLVNPGLWDMVFGGGGASGDPGTFISRLEGVTSLISRPEAAQPVCLLALSLGCGRDSNFR